MPYKCYILLSAVAVAGLAQRPMYAGRQPIGYPVLQTTTTTQNPNDLGNRFAGGDAAPPTTVRLPIEVLGDRQLFDYLSSLPIDKQPFWFINWQALEAHRQRPQTWNLKPNDFVNPNEFGLNFAQWT